MPASVTVISLRPAALSIVILFVMLPFFMSITTTLFISATNNLLPKMPIPFGAFRLVTQLPLYPFPSGPIFPIPPFPSASQGAPSINETYSILLPASCNTDSGTAIVVSVSHTFSKECCWAFAVKHAAAKKLTNIYFIQSFPSKDNKMADKIIERS